MGFKPRITSPAASPTKRFMFLTHGFEKPTESDMAAWGTFFKSLGSRIVDQGGFWNGGEKITKKRTSKLPFGKDSVTGYVIFTASDFAEASELAKTCPVVKHNQLFEIMSK